MTKQLIRFDQVANSANGNLTTVLDTIYGTANAGGNSVDVYANSGLIGATKHLNFINSSSVTVSLNSPGDGNVNVSLAAVSSNIIVQIACSDLLTALGTGVTPIGGNIAYFRSPRTFTLTDIRASLGNASVGNAAYTQGDANSCNIQIYMNGANVLTSSGATAGLRMNQNANTTVGANLAYTIANGSFVNDGLVQIQLVNIGNAANGLIVTFIGS